MNYPVLVPPSPNHPVGRAASSSSVQESRWTTQKTFEIVAATLEAIAHKVTDDPLKGHTFIPPTLRTDSGRTQYAACLRSQASHAREDSFLVNSIEQQQHQPPIHPGRSIPLISETDLHEVAVVAMKCAACATGEAVSSVVANETEERVSREVAKALEEAVRSETTTKTKVRFFAYVACGALVAILNEVVWCSLVMEMNRQAPEARVSSPKLSLCTAIRNVGVPFSFSGIVVPVLAFVVAVFYPMEKYLQKRM